jgi:hypothetical protein
MLIGAGHEEAIDAGRDKSGPQGRETFHRTHRAMVPGFRMMRK